MHLIHRFHTNHVTSKGNNLGFQNTVTGGLISAIGRQMGDSPQSPEVPHVNVRIFTPKGMDQHAQTYEKAHAFETKTLAFYVYAMLSLGFLHGAVHSDGRCR